MGASLLVSGILFAASVFLLLRAPKEALRIVLGVAALIELLLRLGVMRVQLRGVPMHELLAAIFAVVGGIILFRANAKHQVAASTCVTLIGVVALLTSLHVFR